MVVQELIELLESMNPESEVRFASQPSWPFEYSVSDVVEVVEEGEEEEFDDREEDLQPVVYLVEGRQIGYLPGNVKDEIGW
jgi:SpoU rRNA methylase family enzyme